MNYLKYLKILLLCLLLPVSLKGFSEVGTDQGFGYVCCGVADNPKSHMKHLIALAAVARAASL